MRGSIMPEPLAMPPTRNAAATRCVTSTAYSFGNGSVVMIARAAAAPPSAASAATACGIPARIASILRLTPITPVDATSTCSSLQPTALGGELRHLLRVGHALRAGAGVGAAAVGHDRLRAAAARRQVILAEIDRRGLGEVHREHAGGGRRRVADDQREVRLAAGLDAAVQPAGAEAGRRGDAALDRPHVRHGRGGAHVRSDVRRRRFDDACRTSDRARSTIAYWPQLRNSGHELQSCAIFSGTQVCGTIEKPRRTKNAGSCANAHRRGEAVTARPRRQRPRPSARRGHGAALRGSTTSERTSATVCDSGASSAQPTMRSPAAEVDGDDEARRVDGQLVERRAAAGGPLRDAPRSARAAPAHRPAIAARKAICGCAAFNARPDGARRFRPGPLSTTTRIVIFTLSPLPPTPIEARRRECAIASSISAAVTVSGGSMRTTRSAVRLTSNPAFSAASTTGPRRPPARGRASSPAPRTAVIDLVLAAAARAASARTARPSSLMCGRRARSSSSSTYSAARVDSRLPP